MKALVILPTYNESENIPKLLQGIFACVPEDTHVLIVDDHSPDGTGDIAEEMAKVNPRIFVMHRPSKMGLGTAYISGFRYALNKDYQIIVNMDSDFSHSPHYLPSLFNALETSDFAIGSRYVPGGGIKGWPLRRLCLSAFANFYARLILNVKVRDMTGGFRCFRRKVLDSMDLDAILSNGYGFLIEFLWRAMSAGIVVREVPIIFNDRTRGKSKMSARTIWEAVFIVWRLGFLKNLTLVTAAFLLGHYYYFFITNHYLPDFLPSLLKKFSGAR